MKHLAWLLQWTLKAAIFFALFAFALNNPQPVTVHLFFGQVWIAPLVLVVLAAFSAGVAVGVIGMTPRWWRQRQGARQAARLAQAQVQAAPPAGATPPGAPDGA